MTDPADFRWVLKRGVKGSAPGVTVHITPDCPGKAAEAASVGFIVPRSVGTAVVRNRLRRQLRHVCRDVDLGGGCVVVRITPRAARVPDIGESLREAISMAASRGHQRAVTRRG